MKTTKTKRIRILFAAAAASALGLTIAPARVRAQEQCPQPSPQDCLDPAWAQTECGQYEAQLAANDPYEACNWYAAQQVLDYIQQSGQQLSYDYRVVPDGMFEAGEVQPTGLLPDTWSQDFDYFGYPSTYGDHLHRQAVADVNPQSWAAMDILYYKPGWDQNGNAVSSCTEYVYEKWFDYSRYQDDAAALKTDYRAIYNRAIRVPDGINAGPIRSRDGTPQREVVWPDGRIPKNAFFLFQPTSFDRYPMDPTIIPSSAGVEYYTVDWGFHGLMSGALTMAGKTDAEMYDMDKVQETFKKLLVKRAKLIAELEKDTLGSYTMVSVSPIAPSSPVTDVFLTKTDFYSIKDPADLGIMGMSGGALDPTTMPVDCAGYTGKMCDLYIIDGSIAKLLTKAHDKGCLDLYSTSVCDWSPKQFVTYLDKQFVSEMEADFNRCQAITGDDFSPSSLVRTAISHGIIGATMEDYTGSTTDVTSFFDLYENHVATLDFTPAPGSVTDGPVGWWKNGAGSYGSPSLVQAGYHWDVGFGVKRNSTSSVAKCTADLAAMADLGADVTVASSPYSLLDFQAILESADTLFNAHSHLKIVGKDIYSKTLATDYKFTVLDATAKEEQAASGTVVIYGVPVTYSIGIVGEAGVKIDMTVSLHRICVTSPEGEAPTVDLTLTGGIKGTASASVFASGGIGVSWAVVGIKGTLTLIDASMEPAASLSIHPAIAGDLESLVVDMNLSFTKAFGTMGGKITGFAKTPFGTWETTLAEWKDLASSSTTDSKVIHLPLNKIWSKL